jgi:hypothetical protein
MPDRIGRQELEVVRGNEHISFTVRAPQPLTGRMHPMWCHRSSVPVSAPIILARNCGQCTWLGSFHDCERLHTSRRIGLVCAF